MHLDWLLSGLQGKPSLAFKILLTSYTEDRFVLVNSVIRRYLADNRKIDLADIKRLFKLLRLDTDLCDPSCKIFDCEWLF